MKLQMAERQAVQLENQNKMLLHVVNKLDQMSLHPHPPSAQIPSFLSPRQTRNQGQQAALSFPHLPHQVTVNRGSSSSTNGMWQLLASNGDGKDTDLYTVGGKRKLYDFLTSVTSVPLGVLKANKQFDWISANWKSESSTKDKLAGTRNTEARKLMELVLHLATEAELSKMFEPLPQSNSALAIALEEKRIMTENVIVKVMDFLDAHEKKKKPSSIARKKEDTTGALFRRWCVLEYPKTDPNLVEPSSNNILNWAETGMVLDGSATTTSAGLSDSLPKKKRRRNQISVQ